MLERRHKDVYIPLKTVSLSDGTISRWYMVSWYKHDFVFGVTEEEPDNSRSFEFVTAL